MADSIISSGEIVSNTSLSSGDTMTLSGGNAYDTSISSGGQLNVSWAGTASNTSISSGGQLNVFWAGTASNTSISSGGQLIVSNGGTASNTLISSGGQLTLSTGGTNYYTSILSGGQLTLLPGGTNYYTSILSGGQLTLSSGGSAYSTSILSGGQLTVSSSGSASYTSILSGGQLTVSSGGSAYGTSISSGGQFTISSAGAAYVASINVGGNLTLLSGAGASYTSILSGGQLTVSSGGTVSNTLILSGGQLTLSNGGRVVGFGLSSGVDWTVSSGMNVSNASIYSGGHLSITASGNLNGIGLYSGGELSIDSGVILSGLGIYSGVNYGVSSGFSVSGATIYSGGQLAVSSGGDLTSTTISSGGQLVVSLGANVSHIGIAYGGQFTLSPGINMTDVTVHSGGQLSITSGANISGVNVYYGGQLIGTSDNTIVSAYLDDGAQLLAPSATMSNTSIGGNFTTSSGVTFVNTSVYTSTTFTVTSGTIVSTVDIFARGSMIVDSGAVVSNVSAGGPLIISSGGSALDTYVYLNGSVIVSSGGDITDMSLGGSLNVSSGGSINGEVTVLTGGHATIYSDAGGTINLLGYNAGGLTISGLEDGGTVTTVIKNFDGMNSERSDKITLAGVQTSNVTSVIYEDANGNANGDYVTLALNNGNKISLNIPGAQDEGYTLASDANGNLVYEVCFLAGAMIKTAAGDIAVEDIRIGDEILTFDWRNNKEEIKTVRWVGSKTVKVNPMLHDDEAGYPVRILKDAIAEGVPNKDLLITPEHCLFFYGRFTPARMFVNGHSIYYDHSIIDYTYYHIETEEHSVIWADGMLTESYLDTGNQTQFKQHGDIAILTRPTNPKTWEQDAAASLMVERSYVEHLYHTLLQRAIQMQLPMMQPPKKVNNNPNFHLMTKNGLVIEPVSNFKGQYMFLLPKEDLGQVYLISKTSRLNDVVGPFENNRHELGVLVGDIQLLSINSDNSENYITAFNITDHLTQSDLSGWHALEQTPCRWTKGKALLNIPNHSDQEQRLMVHIVSDRLYLVDEKQKERIAV